MARGRAGVGASDHHERGFLWFRTAPAQRIVEYTPPHRFRSCVAEGAIGVDFASSLEATDTGTRLTNHVQLHPRGLLRSVAPLLSRWMSRRVEADLARLKAVLER